MIRTGLILFVIITVAHGEEDTCGALNPLEVCNFDVSKVFVPFNEQQLAMFCKRALSYYSCIQSHAEDFPPDEHEFCGYALALKRAEPLLKDLCNRGSTLYKEYIEHAACFSHIQNHFEECNDAARKIADLYFKVAKSSKYAHRLKPCITGCQFLYKVENMVMDACGEDALRVYTAIVSRSEFHMLYCNTQEEYEKGQEAVREILEGIIQGKIKKKDILFDTGVTKRRYQMFPDGFHL